MPRRKRPSYKGKQTTLINFVREQGSVTPSDVARAFDISPEAATRYLRSLHENGRLCRLSDEEPIYTSSEEAIRRELEEVIKSRPRIVEEAMRRTLEVARFRSGLHNVWTELDTPIRGGPFAWVAERGPEDWTMAVGAVDETYRPIKPKWTIMLDEHPVLISASAVLRLGVIRIVIEHALDGSQRDAKDFAYPPYVLRAERPIEYQVGFAKFKRSPEYIEEPDRIGEWGKAVGSKFQEFRRLKFELELRRFALDKLLENNYGYPSLLAVDGSLIPGHLDPHLEKADIPHDIKESLINLRDEIIADYDSFFRNVVDKGLVAVGVVKKGVDYTLIKEVLREIPDASDQEYLSHIMRDREVVIPFVHHRFQEYARRIREFLNRAPRYVIYKFYIKKSGVKAVPIEILAPRDFFSDESNFNQLVRIIYDRIVKDPDHSDKSELEGVPTLREIYQAHKEAYRLGRAKAPTIQEHFEREIDEVLRELIEKVRSFASYIGPGTFRFDIIG